MALSKPSTSANGSKQRIQVLTSLGIRAHISHPHPISYRICPHDKPLPFKYIEGARRAVTESHHLRPSSGCMSPFTSVTCVPPARPIDTRTHDHLQPPTHYHSQHVTDVGGRATP